MAPFTGNPTHQQMVAMAMTPKITGFLSVCGSGYIVHDCYRQLKASAGGARHTSSSANIYQRLMIGMSISDMIMSFGFVLSTLLAPRGTPNVWGAVGNTQSCTFSGMFNLFGVVPTMYNASLSIYYILRIRNGWTTSQLRRIEPYLHLVPYVWGVAVVLAAVSLKLLNSGLFECWLAPFPQGCTPTYKSTPENPPTCTRGDNIVLYQWGFDMIPKLSSILIVTVNMYLTWYSLYQQERQTRKFSLGSMETKQKAGEDGTGTASGTRTAKRAKNAQAVKLSVAQRLARQSYFYVGALYITYIPVIVARLNEAFTGYVHWEMLYTICFLVPMQGFWNAFVYVRPRYLQSRQEEAKKAAASSSAETTKTTLLGRWFTSHTASTASEGPSPDAAAAPATESRASVRPHKKNVFQTLGEAFRDGAIDDEAELDLLDRSAAASAAAGNGEDDAAPLDGAVAAEEDGGGGAGGGDGSGEPAAAPTVTFQDDKAPEAAAA